MKEKKADRLLNSMLRDWSSMTNYEHIQGGRIWFLWRDTVRMSRVYKTDQLITCSVAMQGKRSSSVLLCMQVTRLKVGRSYGKTSVTIITPQCLKTKHGWLWVIF